MARRPKSFSRYLRNCVPSAATVADWSYEDAVEAGSIPEVEEVPDQVDLREGTESWWTIDDQRETGACVGFATAGGVLRWLYVKHGLAEPEVPMSARFIWMANKETDDLETHPTTFLDSAGTSTKMALGVAQRYGCVPETMLPMSGKLSRLKAPVFYSIAAQFRITSYHNLGTNQDVWRSWIAREGPVLVRLDVDKHFDRAETTGGILETYRERDRGLRGGHAVCLVGYTPEHFIVRNSWGTRWGDQGYAFASIAYAKAAFTEAYGAVL